MQLSELGRRGENENAQTSKDSKGEDSNPGSLDCESGILLLSYRAPPSEDGAMYDGESQFVVKFTDFPCELPVHSTVVPATAGPLGERPPALAGHFCDVPTTLPC